MINLNGFKIFNCENEVPCRGYPEIARCTIIAETAEVAKGLAIEEFPDMPPDNWVIAEVKLTGNPQIIFQSCESN